MRFSRRHCWWDAPKPLRDEIVLQGVDALRQHVTLGPGLGEQHRSHRAAREEQLVLHRSRACALPLAHGHARIAIGAAVVPLDRARVLNST
jgi:hypothetical protein